MYEFSAFEPNRSTPYHVTKYIVSPHVFRVVFTYRNLFYALILVYLQSTISFAKTWTKRYITILGDLRFLVIHKVFNLIDIIYHVLWNSQKSCIFHDQCHCWENPKTYPTMPHACNTESIYKKASEMYGFSKFEIHSGAKSISIFFLFTI